MNISPVNSISNRNNTNFKGAPKIAPSMISQTNAFLHETTTKLGKAYDKFIEDGVAEKFVAPIMNSDLMLKFVDKVGNSKNMASHMSTAGSFVTTAFYIRQTDKTLNKNEEQRKRAKTLELNQALVTGVSTVLGYTANGALGKMSKDLGYKFREVNQGNPKLSKRLKGFDIAKQLLIFSLMYRYVAPVIVTPVASKLTKWWDVRKADKAQKSQTAQLVNMQNQPKAKEVALNSQKMTKSA